MDRNTVIGLSLIFAIMVAWFYFMAPSQEELQRRQAQQARQDSLAALADTTAAQPDTLAEQQPSQPKKQHQLNPSEPETEPGSMGIFAQANAKDTTETVVETPLYRAVFTNVGAGPAKFFLKGYNTWDNQPVQLINDTTKSAYSLGFLSQQNYNIETDQLVFKQLTDGHRFNLAKGDSLQLSYALNLPDGRRMTYTYTLFAGTYEMDLAVDLDGVTKDIVGNSVDFSWQPRLNFTEKNHSQEAHSTSAYVFAGGEMEQFQISDPGSDDNTINGNIRWVSTRTKFFTQVIKAVTPTEGARLAGNVTGKTDNPDATFHYKSALRTKLTDNNLVRVNLFVGPLRYDDLKKFDEHAYDMVNVGYSWIRWFSDPLVRYIIIPFFSLIGNWLNSYGLAIIFFAIAIKLVLYPLTKKSFESMAAMKELQPELKELQEKYKDNPQKQQQETMKLYKKAKVNPMGGCLPNLLQFPVLITLYRFFQNSILIRQKAFLWVHDLSAPDMLIHLPFNVPFLGDHLGGFVVLMSATMMIQSQLTGGMSGGGGGNPSMKSFQYILPFVLLFVFNNFAAGLSLYYLIYNALSIGQQLMINRQMEQKKELEAAAG